MAEHGGKRSNRHGWTAIVFSEHYPGMIANAKLFAGRSELVGEWQGTATYYGTPISVRIMMAWRDGYISRENQATLMEQCR